MILFPFQDYWWFYAGFIVFILVVLALDLGVFHKEAHEVSFKESSIWTAIWISFALVFNLLFYLYAQYRFSTDEKYSFLNIDCRGNEEDAQLSGIDGTMATGLTI